MIHEIIYETCEVPEEVIHNLALAVMKTYPPESYIYREAAEAAKVITGKKSQYEAPELTEEEERARDANNPFLWKNAQVGGVSFTELTKGEDTNSKVIPSEDILSDMLSVVSQLKQD